MLGRILLGVVIVLILALVGVYGSGLGWYGTHEGPGQIAAAERPSTVVAQRADAQDSSARSIGVETPKQILFGDLHVHTTFSVDAFFLSVPLVQGEGAHPPADACDFARYCSALDFWSINDHAEGLTPAHWDETVGAIRECNAVAGDPSNPDTVAYLGWEWTQVGQEPADHYGHKNVILAHTESDRIPTRPIASRGRVGLVSAVGVGTLTMGALATMGRDSRYQDAALFLQERRSVPDCPDGVPVRELPADCHEAVPTPGELFAKLDEWGHDAIVIPHGTTWGFYTPPGSTWDKQLTAAQNDPNRQTLIEVYSGHGNSEEYRDWRAVSVNASGETICPEPSPDYLPTCWQAGEIIRQRCQEAGASADECEGRAAEARANAVVAGQVGHLTVPGAEAVEWLDSGQCTDCTLPAFNYRPGGAAQYLLALTNFDDPGDPKRFRLGFMASSDNHTARPGTGFKELDRREMTEATGPSDPDRILVATRPEPVAFSKPFDREESSMPIFQMLEAERQASFFLTGGLIAAHAPGRDRGSIWDALQRREVYGTSGPRILLWFDLLTTPGGAEGRTPMGSAVAMKEVPRFQVRAVGSFEQAAGCPDYATGGLTPERLHHLCRGECYNPSDLRRVIERIEVVRIRPQKQPNEPVAPLIEDPWRSFACPPDPAGCTVVFDDPQFARDGRDSVYYVRAVEAPSQAVNADNLRCTKDDEGRCLEPKPCYGDYRTPYEDDCLAEVGERAWSSPIYVDFGP